MSDIAQATDGDILVTANSATLVYGGDEVRQRLRQRLRAFLGEWFLDTSKGMPYMQRIFVKGTPLKTIGSYYKQEILEAPGVLGLLSFTLEFEASTRALSVTFSVKSSDDEIIAISEAVTL